MLVHTSPDSARHWTYKRLAAGKTIALVPTMGALHDGHLSLVRRGRKIADHVAVSIFVNPIQFTQDEDLQSYPRPLDDDLAALEREGASMVFTPTNDVMYSPHFSTLVEPPVIARTLEGEFRPEHFRGVCTIVLKLFHAIPANYAIFGQKDYQQACVIEAMTDDLNVGIEIDVAPIVRDADGLAMSSRNVHLNPDERQRSLAISQAIFSTERAFSVGERSASKLQSGLHESLAHSGLDRIDYAVIVDAKTLMPIGEILQPAVALVAAHVGSTRLIDNTLLDPSPRASLDEDLKSESR